MAAQKLADVLLSWSKLIPVSEGQDPLGLNLRVSARLGSQLLFCITSITPRARYYSLLPWCISLYSTKKSKKSLRDTILSLEKAFVVGCVAKHGGKPCKDGRLVGSDNIIKWYKDKQRESVDLSRTDHVQNPALSAYFASLVNLRMFANTEEAEESEGESGNLEPSTDDLELSSIGKQVVEAYGKAIRSVPVIGRLPYERRVLIEDLKLWGNKGGLCELRESPTPDRRILTDLFFNNVGFETLSHNYRRKTLLLILFLSERLSGLPCALNAQRLNDAVYFNQILNDQAQAINVKWPDPLLDIVMRWRMFHFHYYFSAVMEHLFVNVVNRARQAGIEGFRLKDMIEEFSVRNVTKRIEGLLDNGFSKPFLDLTPRQFLQCFDLDIEHADALSAKAFGEAVKISHTLSENNLHDLLTSKEQRFTPESSIVGLILWVVLTLRFAQWEESKYGKWLAGAISDPYEDLSIPVVVRGIRSRFGDYWNTSWRELAAHLINKFVIQLHLILAYQKSGAFIYSDQDVIRWRGKNYDSPAYGNPRFNSAVIILKDLGLLAEPEDNPKILSLTKMGKDLLEAELAKEGRQ